MKISQVAAQMFTVREFTKTAEDFAKTIKKLRDMGYEAVQISGIGPIPDDEIVRILDGEGMVCCATHEPGDKILSEPQEVADHLERINCKHTAFPSPGKIKLDTEDDVADFAEKLNEAGEVLQKAGKVLSYHNHHVEFRQIGGKTILQAIYDQTDPRFLQGEIDTYWVQYGGGCPTEWCRKLKNRLPLLHLKDYQITDERQPAFAEIGYGNLNWESIIPAAEESGCEWFLIEQDTCPGDPFESLKMSFEYLRDNVAS